MTRDEAKNKIQLLIDKFSSQKDYYKSTNYNETETRQDFINPFFKALGWDIDNRKQQLETYRDVRHEDRVKINGRSKAPDYSFNVEGKRKFLSEEYPNYTVNYDMAGSVRIRRNPFIHVVISQKENKKSNLRLFKISSDIHRGFVPFVVLTGILPYLLLILILEFTVWSKFRKEVFELLKIKYQTKKAS